MQRIQPDRIRRLLGTSIQQQLDTLLVAFSDGELQRCVTGLVTFVDFDIGCVEMLSEALDISEARCIGQLLVEAEPVLHGIHFFVDIAHVGRWTSGSSGSGGRGSRRMCNG
jgi:hypothetical protein